MIICITTSFFWFQSNQIGNGTVEGDPRSVNFITGTTHLMLFKTAGRQWYWYCFGQDMFGSRHFVLRHVSTVALVTKEVAYNFYYVFQIGE